MLTLDLYQKEEVKKDADFARLVDALLSVLKREIEVYEELRVTIEEEARVLKRPSLDGLYQSNSKKETLILKARMLEEGRGNIVKKIATTLGREEKEVTMTLLCSCLEGPQEITLRAQQQTLFALISSLKETNENNKVLLDFSLSYVRNTMNFVSNLLSAGDNYGNTGKLKTAGLHGRILSQKG